MKKKIKLLLAVFLAVCMAGCGAADVSETQTASTEAAVLVGAGIAADMNAAPEEADSAASDETESDAEAEEDGESPEAGDAEEETAEDESGEEEAGEADESGSENESEEADSEGEEEENDRPSGNINMLSMAAASNLQLILEEQLIPQFEEQYPDLKLDVTYGNSEQLKEEIEKGSAYDLFFCASKKPMSQLVEEGLIMEDSVHFLMSNELVLFIPRTSRIGIADVNDISRADSVAIGDPADVPVGEYTIESLKEQELWDTVHSKEIYLGSSVAEVIKWVEDEEVDCGFAYRNDVITHMDKLYIVEGLAPTTFRIGILGSTGRLEAATAFSDFLQTDEVLAQFVAHGFTLPK